MDILSIIILSIALIMLIISVYHQDDNSKKPIIYGIICAVLVIIGVIIYISWMRGLNI